MLIYLAHPIDNGSSGFDIRTWTKIDRALAAEGLTTYDPEAGWHFGGHRPSRAIDLVNATALEQSSGVLARLPEGVVTHGTPVEIERALALGLAVAIVIDEGMTGVMLQRWNWLGAWVGYQWQEAVEWLSDKIHSRIMGDELKGLSQRLDELRPEVAVAGIENLKIGRQGDAGWDLVVSKRVIIDPGKFVDVHCGVYAGWPEGVFGWIVGRSSTLRAKGLLVNQGIIDQGYRGELMVGVWNLREKSTVVEVGDRIAQIIPLPQLASRVAVVAVRGREDLPEGDRGEQGFGSSGL